MSLTSNSAILAVVAAVAVIAVVLLSRAPSAGAADATLITKPSKHSAAATLDKLTTLLESKGITIFARVDHAAGAAKIGTELPATELLIFGNPKLGTPLMTANRAAGIDLPMKALAWTDGSGKTYLSYTDPAVLKARWSIEGRDEVFAKMTGALDKMTTAATSD